MNVTGLNHFNIMASQPLLQKVRDFYVDIIGLEEGFRPDFGVPGYWLYAGEVAVLHLLESSDADAEDAGSAPPSYLDHIALSCTDVDATEARLHQLGQDVHRRDFPNFGLAQLILKDPGGLGVELNFAL